MDLIDKKINELSKWEKKKEAFASVISMISGNPSSLDNTSTDIINAITDGRYPKGLTPFIVKVKQFEQEYDTLMIKSSNGAYMVVKTKVPAEVDGEIEMKDTHAIVFSQHPNFLSKVYLDKRDDNYPSDEEIEQKITQLPARYEEDILRKDEETGTTNLMSSWILRDIRDHRTIFEKLLLDNGAIMEAKNSLIDPEFDKFTFDQADFLKNNFNIKRSSSAALWFERNKVEKDKFDCFVFVNPKFGRVALFLSSTALVSPVGNWIIKALSIKANKEPLKKENLESFAHQKFAKIATDIIQLEEPYLEINSKGTKTDKIAKGTGGKVRDGLQGAIHMLRNSDPKSLGVSLTISGALVLVMHIPLFFLASVSKTGALFKSVQSSARALGKSISPPKKAKEISSEHDVSPVLASLKNNNTVTDDKRGFVLNATYPEYMTPLPADYIIRNWPDAVNYTDEYEEEWAKAVLLDTLGFQAGTLFSWKTIENKTYLKAKQPNGLDIYYNTEQKVAFAMQARKPYEYSHLEEPIEKLFNKLPEGKKIIALQQQKDGKIKMEYLSELSEIPKTFPYSGKGSIECIKANKVDIDKIGRHNQLRPEQVLSDKLIKKYKLHKNFVKSSRVVTKDSRFIPFPERLDYPNRNSSFFINADYDATHGKLRKAISKIKSLKN